MLGAMYQSSIRAQDIGNFQEQSSIEGIGMNLDRFPASLPETDWDGWIMFGGKVKRAESQTE